MNNSTKIQSVAMSKMLGIEDLPDNNNFSELHNNIEQPPKEKENDIMENKQEVMKTAKIIKVMKAEIVAVITVVMKMVKMAVMVATKVEKTMKMVTAEMIKMVTVEMIKMAVM